MACEAAAMKAIVFAFVVAGCGSPSKAPAPTEPAKPAESVEHHEMMNMPPEVSKFHDVLAPHWHAEKGPKRMKETCAALPEMSADAEALAKSAAPDGKDPAVWSAATKELVDAVAALKGTCDGNDADGFETAFERVHHSFHALMGEHEGHEASR
jgi:hypothetical protein